MTTLCCYLTWFDQIPFLLINNNIYYRLTQFDIDGEFEIFGPIVVQRNIIERKPVKYINSIGQEINPYNSKGLIITIYDDGSIIKTIK